MFLDNSVEDAARIFQPTNVLSQRPSGHTRGSLPVNSSPRLSSDDSVSFQQMRSSRSSVGSSSSTISSSFSNSQEHLRYNPRSFGDTNGQGASQVGDNEKKLEDEEDSFYQYINNIPGQTQQLMQLHQVFTAFFYCLCIRTKWFLLHLFSCLCADFVLCSVDVVGSPPGRAPSLCTNTFLHECTSRSQCQMFGVGCLFVGELA